MKYGMLRDLWKLGNPPSSLGAILTSLTNGGPSDGVTRIDLNWDDPDELILNIRVRRVEASCPSTK